MKSVSGRFCVSCLLTFARLRGIIYQIKILKEDKSMQKEKSKILTLFLTFLKIGAFTFGGGYAMIPLIQREIVLRRRWITDDDILEITAIAESTARTDSGEFRDLCRIPCRRAARRGFVYSRGCPAVICHNNGDIICLAAV